MKKFLTSLFVLCLLVYASASFAGMHGRGRGGWGPESQYSKMYDPKTVETISGTVDKVEKITPNKGMSYGVHLLVKTDKETIDVHVGPGWYLENQDVMVVKGDKIEIKGSRVNFRGKPAIIAAEIKKGNEVLQLRDESGYPAWSGWRRR